MVFAVDVMLFLFLAKQSLDFECQRLGDDFPEGTMISPRSLFCSANRVSWQPELRGFSQPLTGLATRWTRRSQVARNTTHAPRVSARLMQRPPAPSRM